MFRKFLCAASLIWLILVLAACSSADEEIFSSDSTSSTVLLGSMDCPAPEADDKNAKNQDQEQQNLPKSGIHQLTPVDLALEVDRLPSIGYNLSRGVPINQITVSPPAKLRPIEKVRLFQSSASPTYRTYPLVPLEPSTVYKITATWGQCFDGVAEPVLSTRSWLFTTAPE